MERTEASCCYQGKNSNEQPGEDTMLELDQTLANTLSVILWDSLCKKHLEKSHIPTPDPKKPCEWIHVYFWGKVYSNSLCSKANTGALPLCFHDALHAPLFLWQPAHCCQQIHLRDTWTDGWMNWFVNKWSDTSYSTAVVYCHVNMFLFLCGHQFSIPLGIYWRVKSLDHLVTPIFWGIANLFSKLGGTFYTLTINARGFQCLYFLTNTSSHCSIIIILFSVKCALVILPYTFLNTAVHRMHTFWHKYLIKAKRLWKWALHIVFASIPNFYIRLLKNELWANKSGAVWQQEHGDTEVKGTCFFMHIWHWSW